MKSLVCFSNKNKIEENEYNFDDKGNEIESIYHHLESSSIKKSNSLYEYDENDNWIKRIYYMDEIPKFIVKKNIKYYQPTLDTIP